MKNLILLLFAAGLVGCSTLPVETTEPVPAAPVPAVKLPANCASILKGLDAGCPQPGKYGAMDLVGKIDRKLAETAACLGVHTFIKYYDYQGERPWHETLKGKVPTAEELGLLAVYGFNYVGVFQHFNNQEATFTASRGKKDAERALELAAKWGQPKGSAIYFGVDGDFSPKLPPAYFAAAAPVIRAAGYRVGMYGSGGNCKALKAAGHIDGDLCFLAASAWAWNGTKVMLTEGKGFALKQKVNQSCIGRSLDYDEVMQADFGQWAPGGGK